eukprot:768283-Pleurochrysis_carterae.AAC.1
MHNIADGHSCGSRIKWYVEGFNSWMPMNELAVRACCLFSPIALMPTTECPHTARGFVARVSVSQISGPPCACVAGLQRRR